MDTLNKLNKVLGWLTAINFDKPELSNDLEEPIMVLNEATFEVKNLSLSDFVIMNQKDSAVRDLLFAYEKMRTNHLIAATDEWRYSNVDLFLSNYKEQLK